MISASLLCTESTNVAQCPKSFKHVDILTITRASDVVGAGRFIYAASAAAQPYSLWRCANVYDLEQALSSEVLNDFKKLACLSER